MKLPEMINNFLHKPGKRNFLIVGVTVFLLLVVYYPSMVWLNIKYSDADSYYSHGYLIPLVSAFIVWQKRKELLETIPTSSLTGLFLLIAGLALHVFSVWYQVNFTSALSLVVVISGLVLYLGGKEIFRKLLFPLGYLVFMLPLPSIMTIYITFKMKLMAAVLAVKVIDLTGLPVQLIGSYIILPNGTLEVGDACSGLRSLISLLALGAVAAYFFPASQRGKFLLFVFSIPVALAANVFRIVADTWVCYIYGTGPIFKAFHDFSGLLIFLIALVFLFIIGKGILWFPGLRDKKTR